MSVEVPIRPPGAVRARAIRPTVGEIAGDAHRVDADHDGGLDLDGELEAHLVALPEVLDLGGLAFRQADPRMTAIALNVADPVRVIQAEPSAQLGDGDVWTRGDEAAQAGCTWAFAGAHWSATMTSPESTPMRTAVQIPRRTGQACRP